MTYSQSRGFNAVTLLGWLRSEAAENYRPARYELMSDPWYGSDPTYSTASAYVPVVVTW